MALYYYQALDVKGKKRKGFIEAYDERDAKSKLKEQGVFITKLSTKSPFLSRQNLRGEDLIAFTLLLSQLISSDIPLFESLVAIEEQYRDSKYHRILLSLCEQVKGGSRLSSAMQAFPESFDRLYCAMIQAGESAGALDIVLEKLCVLLTKRMKLKKEVNTALIYPSILAVFALIVIGVLLGFVIPSIEGIFQDRKLNSFTQFVISLSHFSRNYFWIYTPIILGCIGSGVYQLRKPSAKAWMLKWAIKMPLIGKVLVEASMSRYCRTVATLDIGGLPLIDSLRLSRETLENPALEEDVAKAESKIIEGGRLSQELMRSKWIPHLVPRMLAIGEETGHMAVMLNKVADIYEDELEKTMSRVLSLLQPIILMIMGTIVGLVLISILLPLTELSSF